jgi:hypothetical protein
MQGNRTNKVVVCDSDVYVFPKKEVWNFVVVIPVWCSCFIG